MGKSIILLLLVLPIYSWAQEGLNTQSVSIFKDKTAFFVKNGTVKAPDGSWSIYGDTIPKALNGTFWLSSPNNDFEMVKAYRKKIETPSKAMATDFFSMLALNDGKTATLHFKDTSFAGKVLFMQTPPKKDQTIPNLNKPLLALVQSNGKTQIFNRADINNLKRLEFDEVPTYLYDYTASEKVPTLQIDFKSKKEEQPLDMMYLSNGLAWKPDYKIDLIADDKARLSLRSTVINGAEDIKTKKLNLVAGVPNFKYATEISSLIDFLGILPTNLDNGYVANIANFSNIAQSAGGYANDRESTAQPEQWSSNASNLEDATAIEDLYFYTLKDIELKKGERAFFDIFSAEVPVQHIYEAVLSNNSISYSLEYSFIKKENPVIHTIKLTNTSNFTWTAAPALVLKNNKKQNAPISQDKLSYTSIKDDVSVKLTEAPDVSVRFLEKETNREANKKNIKKGKYTYYHDLVSVETEVTIHNYKNKDIQLDLKRLITGELKDSNEKWQLSPRVQFGYTLNKMTDVCWEIKLKAGEQKTIKYSYSFYTTEHR